jgi:hypothetical protein
MRAFLRHGDGTDYRVEDVVLKPVDEEREFNGQKVKVTRTGLFRKSGGELVPPEPPAGQQPRPAPGTEPFAPRFEMLPRLPFPPPSTTPPKPGETPVELQKKTPPPKK